MKSFLTNYIWIYCHDYIGVKIWLSEKSGKWKREHVNVILHVHSRSCGEEWQNIDARYAAIYTTGKLATRPGPNLELLLKIFLKIGPVQCAARQKICLKKWIKRIYLKYTHASRLYFCSASSSPLLNKDNAQNVLAKIVLEPSNAPTTKEADDIFFDKNNANIRTPGKQWQLGGNLFHSLCDGISCRMKKSAYQLAIRRILHPERLRGNI